MDFRRLLVFSTCFLVAVLGCTLSTVRATGEQEENGPNAEESLGLARNRPSRDEDEVMEEGTFKLSDTKDGELIDGLMTTDGRTIDPEEFGATFDTVILPYDELCFFQPAKKGVNLHVEFHVSYGPPLPDDVPNLHMFLHCEVVYNVTLPQVHCTGFSRESRNCDGYFAAQSSCTCEDAHKLGFRKSTNICYRLGKNHYG